MRSLMRTSEACMDIRYNILLVLFCTLKASYSMFTKVKLPVYGLYHQNANYAWKYSDNKIISATSIKYNCPLDCELMNYTYLSKFMLNMEWPYNISMLTIVFLTSTDRRPQVKRRCDGLAAFESHPRYSYKLVDV